MPGSSGVAPPSLSGEQPSHVRFEGEGDRCGQRESKHLAGKGKSVSGGLSWLRALLKGNSEAEMECGKTGYEMKLERWAGLSQGSLLGSTTPVLPSSVPLTLRLPHPYLVHASCIPHPLASTLTAAVQFSPSEPEVSGQPLAHTGEDPGAWQHPVFSGSRGEKNEDLGEGQGWPGRRKIQGAFHLLIESSQAPTCPVFRIPPPAWNCLTYPGYPANLDPGEQVSA